MEAVVSQLEWTETELLETHTIAEPLVADGLRCHGGFADDGAYVSPRTKNRWTAIDNWKAARETTFGTPLLDIGLDAWPAHYPNVAQAKYLLAQGVREPLISTLTRIGTVEGFGAYLRYSPVPEMQHNFDEDVRGTATDHLNKGLFEAHARDEAGFEDEGGHKQMWFAARDIAFERPVTGDETEVMLQRMGIGTPGTSSAMQPTPTLPHINTDLEFLIARMASLLLIEISAFHVFAWAEEVLADTDLTAGEGEAARLVSFIRADETPHVEYLKTSLSEMRDRTFIGNDGKRYAGTEIVGSIWDRSVAESLGVRREQNLKLTLNEVKHALATRVNGAEILEGYHALADVVPDDTGAFKPVAQVAY